MEDFTFQMMDGSMKLMRLMTQGVKRDATQAARGYVSVNEAIASPFRAIGRGVGRMVNGPSCCRCQSACRANAAQASCRRTEGMGF